MISLSRTKKNIVDHIDDVEEIPLSLYKYYKPNPAYDVKRLNGEVYFSSPLKFNDPLDSQLVIENNTKDLSFKNSDKLLHKLIELDYFEDEAVSLTQKLPGLPDDDPIIKEIYNKQLERLGILCLTEDYKNPIMWGYYTDNDGYCLEYDPSTLIKDVLISFVNELPDSLVRHFIGKKNYQMSNRDEDNKPQRCGNSLILFTNEDLLRITNKELLNAEDSIKLNFIRNMYVKRCWGRKVDYKDELHSTKPTLFMGNGKSSLNGKYYTKLKAWENEREYRLILSLGGNMAIKLPKESIKSITLGCNISTDNVRNILSILDADKRLNSSFIFYKIVRTTENGLDRKEIDSEKLINLYNNLKKGQDELSLFIKKIGNE